MTYYIGSFSANPKNEYLWNNYANKSNGIVICFKYDSLNNLNKINIKNVDYGTDKEKRDKVEKIIRSVSSNIANKKKPVLKDYMKIIEVTIIYALIFKKANGPKGEKYIEEEEYRIIGLNIEDIEENHKRYKDDNGVEFINLPLTKIEFYKSIEKIIFGSKCNPYQKNIIKKICNDKGIKCQFIE